MKNITKILSTLTVSSLVLTSCADLFQSKVPMVKHDNLSDLSSLVIPDVKVTKLTAPAQIFVSQAESASQIVVSWSKVNGATSYYLERAVSTKKDASGKFIVPTENDFSPVPLSRIYSTQYVDTILSNPKYSDDEYSYRYFYRVAAENPRLKIEMSDFIVSEDAYLLAPPSNVKASLGESTTSITVRWDKVLGARSYDIYRSTRDDGSASVYVGSVSSNQNWFDNKTTTNDQGVDFYYSVYTKTASNQSIASSLALGYAQQIGAPPKIQNVKVTDGRGTTTDSITISWDKVSDSEIKYAVYRTSSKDASYTLLNKDCPSGTFKDTKNLKPNVYYYYQIQSYKMEGENKIKAPFSDSGIESKTPAEGFLLVPPTDIAIMKNPLDASTCSVTFPAVIGSQYYPGDSKLTNAYNNYSYEILSCDTQDGVYASAGEFPDTAIVADNNGNYVIPVTANKFFKVVTKNEAAVSGDSEICAPAPYAAESLTASKAANIGGDANTNGVFPVKLTWASPKNDTVDGGYNIYRSTSIDSGFKKINEAPVKGTTYIDSNDTAKAGVYYFYKVLSLNSLEQGANYTDAVHGYGALTPEQYMREYNKTVINSQKKLTLMHIADDMKKLGSESAKGDITGSLSYNAAIAGLGARIVMHYEKYADYWANDDQANGYFFYITGDTNTSASMDASGTMDGTVVCEGMYPGSVRYNNIKIKGGAAGGGTYGITRQGFDGIVEVDWKVGEEGK